MIESPWTPRPAPTTPTLTVSFNCLGWNVTSDPMPPVEAWDFVNELAQKGIPYTLNFS